MAANLVRVESQFAAGLQSSPNTQSQYLVLELNYKWLHNPPTFRKTAMPDWFRLEPYRYLQVARLQLHASTHDYHVFIILVNQMTHFL